MSNIRVDRIHFHTFDSLRFLSFLLVFLSHVPIESSVSHYFSKGKIGVSFFFVLSGFLITYILILEKINNHGEIPLKKFFRRRILRIWPLYYVMILFAFCTPFILNILHLPYSNEGYEPNWLFSLTFLENYRMMYTGDIPNVSPLPVTWSLCVEEHFYIIWGIIIYCISLKNIPKLIVISIIISIVFRMIYNIFNIKQMDVFSNIDYFAFGAIPAYIFIFHKEVINKLTLIPAIYKYLYFFMVILIIVLVPFYIPPFKNISLDSLLFCFLFSILILFTLGSKNAFKISDQSILARLGKYTYGLYFIHSICIKLFEKLGHKYHLNWVLVIIIAFISSVALAFLSYHLFEKQFLKLKK